MGKVRRRRESELRFGSAVDRGEGESRVARFHGRRSRNGGRRSGSRRGGLGTCVAHWIGYQVGVGLKPV
jgi:hypothetical protein